MTRLDLIKGFANDLLDILDASPNPGSMALDAIETIIECMGEQLGAHRWETENPGLFALQQEADIHRAALTEEDDKRKALEVVE
jgi:hypothetical protein